MLSSGLRRFTAISRHVQARNFSRTARQNKIITSAPLRAKEVSPMIGNKYPIIDHEYDAVVVGAGGSGQSN
jgi:succinate dehydrogenase (ubiquinone) flavoprotein subunit